MKKVLTTDNLDVIKRKIGRVENIEKLKQSNLKVGDVIEVLGYYSADDGATHKRVIASEDDGSGVQLSNKLWANIVHNGEVNVSWFGAKGDGITDDTEAIQKAMQYSCVYIPEGIYNITNLNIGNKIIRGDGLKTKLKVSGVITIENTYSTLLKSFSILVDGTNYDYLIWVKKSYHVDFKNISFSDPNNLGNIGIYFDGTDSCFYHTIRECDFSKFNTAVKFYNAANACLVDNNSFYSCKENIIIDSCDGNRITNNTFQSFKISGVCLKNSNATFPTSSNTIAFNYFETEHSAIDTTFVGDIDLSNNERCIGNFILCNQWTFAKIRSHIVNDFGDNLNLDNTYKDYNVPNSFLGFNKFPIRKKEEKVYKGEEFDGVIAPFKNNDGNTELCFHGYDSGRYIWNKLVALKDNNSTTIEHLFNTRLNQGYLGGIQLGYDIQSKLDKMITFDTNLDLIKIYRTTTNSWQYYQKCESGTTEKRPTWKPAGYQYFDTTLGKPIFSRGDNTWVDSTGTNASGINIAQLNTLYHGEKMKEEGVYNDFITYMDDRTAYDKEQRELENQRQEQYQKALLENPELTYEDWLSQQPTYLPYLEEPKPSEALKKFMEKYL